MTLDQTAAGRYEADFAAVAEGAYLVSVKGEDDEVAPVTGAVNSYSPEFSIAGADAHLLARISEVTGGQVLPASNVETNDTGIDLFERRATRTRPHEIWEALLLAALLVLPFDVGVRRLHITREQMDEARDWIAKKVRRQKTPVTADETPISLDKLKGARARVKLTHTSARADEMKEAQAVASVLLPADRVQPAQSEKIRAQASVSQKPARADSARADEKHEDAVDTVPGEAEPLSSRLLNARRKRRE